MLISPADTSHISLIQEIAIQTWKETYKDILSDIQFQYMIDMMYSNEALAEQMQKSNHEFLLIKDDLSNDFQGFVSYETNYKEQAKTKIHKLYVLPQCHGLGMGKQLIEKVISIAIHHKNSAITLNMNRDNKTYSFYKRMGFEIIGEEDIEIGNGYLMEDYIFEKNI